MKFLEKLGSLFKRNKVQSSAPLLIIQKGTDDSETKEYATIEEAIANMEKDLNFSKEKIEKLKTSLQNLKNRSSIKIRNGEIVE